MILDIGMCAGHDSLYYLGKGFRVVGVEPREDLVSRARQLLRPWLKSGQMTIITAAVAEGNAQSVEFWINPEKDDWGSLHRVHAEKGTTGAVRVEVPRVSLSEIFAEFGVPYYLKTDTEGGEDAILSSLAQQPRAPEFMSFEIWNPDQLSLLTSLPYQSFQIRNQWMNPFISERAPSLEGKTNPTKFTHEHSGPFGRDLPEDQWMTVDQLQELVRAWFLLSSRDRALVGHGWLDIHCSHRGLG